MIFTAGDVFPLPFFLDKAGDGTCVIIMHMKPAHREKLCFELETPGGDRISQMRYLTKSSACHAPGHRYLYYPEKCDIVY